MVFQLAAASIKSLNSFRDISPVSGKKYYFNADDAGPQSLFGSCLASAENEGH